MRAVVIEQFGTPEGLALRRVPRPIPKPQDLLLRVIGCGVCGHDILGRQGKAPARLDLAIGHEIAGVVEAVGADAGDRFSIGDRVASRQRRSCHECAYCSIGRTTLCERGLEYGEDVPGGYAEFVTVDARGAAPVPPSVDDAAAAIAACAIGTVVHAFRLAKLSAGERVIVTGASGGLGVHALQVAREAGAEVVAITTTPAHAERLAELADAVIVSKGGGFASEVRRRGLVAELVFDLTARFTLEQSLRSTRRGGRTVVVGNLDSGSVAILPGAFIMREMVMLGANSADLSDLESALRYLERGVVDAEIDRVLPLEQAPHAHALLEQRSVRGRIVLDPRLKASQTPRRAAG